MDTINHTGWLKKSKEVLTLLTFRVHLVRQILSIQKLSGWTKVSVNLKSVSPLFTFRSNEMAATLDSCVLCRSMPIPKYIEKISFVLTVFVKFQQYQTNHSRVIVHQAQINTRTSP
jgi:hypothetical protein